MIEVDKKLFVSDIHECFHCDKNNWVVVHACKIPCHQYRVGYNGNLNPKHPNYLIKEDEKHLVLNIVDMNKLIPLYTKPIIDSALNFIENNIETKNILIHCNKGISRSPAIALLFMAKRKKSITNESYNKAKKEFLKIYPRYNPGLGIDNYLTKYWNDIT